MTLTLQPTYRWLVTWRVLLGLFIFVPACSVQKANTMLDVHTTTATDTEASCCKKAPPPVENEVSAQGLSIPDEELVDQNGHRVHFFSDLVKGKTVAICFFFTSCTTVCPLLTANMARVQQELLKRGRDDVQLISLSVDPVTDTPTRLKAWSKTFSARPGWAFLTGNKLTVDHLLKALRSFTPDPQDHSPMILIGNEPNSVWKQVSGLSSADVIANEICSVAGAKAEDKPEAPGPLQSDARPQKESPTLRGNPAAKNYFSDVELTDQNGITHRLYSDLIRGRVLLVNSFFSSCTGVCPVMAQKIREIRRAFPQRVGKDFFILSISVDPKVDTPQRLNEYARNLHADRGWFFLTGIPENVETALHKFGMNVDGRENHSNLFLIGNDGTGLWKKAFSLAPTKDLVTIVADVLNDQPDSPRVANQSP